MCSRPDVFSTFGARNNSCASTLSLSTECGRVVVGQLVAAAGALRECAPGDPLGRTRNRATRWFSGWILFPARLLPTTSEMQFNYRSRSVVVKKMCACALLLSLLILYLYFPGIYSLRGKLRARANMVNGDVVWACRKVTPAQQLNALMHWPPVRKNSFAASF